MTIVATLVVILKFLMTIVQVIFGIHKFGDEIYTCADFGRKRHNNWIKTNQIREIEARIRAAKHLVENKNTNIEIWRHLVKAYLKDLPDLRELYSKIVDLTFKK